MRTTHSSPPYAGERRGEGPLVIGSLVIDWSLVLLPREQAHPLPPTPPELWTRSHRGALLAFLIGLTVLIGWRMARDTRYLPDPAPDVPARAGDLADRIDPNTAEVQTLAALPTVGRQRAEAIVAYRERHRARTPDRPAFARPEDLLKVDGIGVAMVATVEPYLRFPRDAGQDP